jgi:hypothetical protein
LKFRTGRKPQIYDKRTLRLAKYLDLATLPHPPNAVNLSNAVLKQGGYPMDSNNVFGDCVLAAAGHQVQSWTYGSGDAYCPSNDSLVSIYKTLSPNDDGVDMLTFLKYWRQVGIDNRKISAFVALDTSSLIELEYALYLFGGCFLGVSLPDAIVNAVDPFDPAIWVLPADGALGDYAPRLDNGHCVHVSSYARNYSPVGHVIDIVTWGAVVTTGWRMIASISGGNCGESYAMLSSDWLRADKEAPNGFNLAQLQTDLAAITHQ